MSYNDYELDELLSVLDMQSWLDSHGIAYRPTRGSRGPQLNVKECPVCGGSKWKVYLNADTGLGNCFSGECEKKFNKWSFIRASLGGMTTREVIESIKKEAKEQGWRPAKLETAPVIQTTELILPESYALPINGKNLKYLTNRNIPIEIARYFHLRYSLNGKFEFKDETGKTKYQSYSKRIIVPIYDLDGKMVSFQGRDITGTAEKKYLFPPGFASTGSIIYNGQNAIGAEHIVLGEGVFDVMAIKIALDQQMQLRDIAVGGTFGKHLSFGDENSQVAKLMKLGESGLKIITFMWDGEKKAISDAVDAALMLNGYGFKTKIAILPKDRDPNEVAPSIVREAFWKAITVNAITATKIKLMKF